MTGNTYEKVTSHSLIFRTPLTRWIVRDKDARKIGTITETEKGYEVRGGSYDANGNFISSFYGVLCPTFLKAQARFRNK